MLISGTTMKILNHAIILTTKERVMIYGCYIVVSCPNSTQVNNGLLNCSLEMMEFLPMKTFVVSHVILVMS